MYLYLWTDYMWNYDNINIDIWKLEKDYWEWILKEYIKISDYTKKKYIKNPYKDRFMKTTIGIADYKISMIKELWKYWSYLFAIWEYAREDNSIDMNLYKEKIAMSDSSFIRLVRAYKDSAVLRKRGDIFYLNPLVVHYGRNIDYNLWELFKDELEKVWITIK